MRIENLYWIDALERTGEKLTTLIISAKEAKREDAGKNADQAMNEEANG